MIAAVILSAGESRRMGSPKALLTYPLPNGGSTRFVERLIDVFGRSRAEPVLLVLGHEPDVVRNAIDCAPVRVVVNESYRSGMLSSIQAAVSAVADEPQIEGVLICPVDHPAVTTELVDELIARFESTRAPVILPTHGGKRGHPVLFGRAVFDALLRAPETVGARQVVWDYEGNLLEVEVSEPGIRVDVDTPEAYREFIERAGGDSG